MTGLWISSVLVAFVIGWVWRGAITQRQFDRAMAGWRAAQRDHVYCLEQWEQTIAAWRGANDHLEIVRGRDLDALVANRLGNTVCWRWPGETDVEFRDRIRASRPFRDARAAMAADIARGGQPPRRR